MEEEEKRAEEKNLVVSLLLNRMNATLMAVMDVGGEDADKSPDRFELLCPSFPSLLHKALHALQSIVHVC
jgi:hypothetical protein